MKDSYREQRRKQSSRGKNSPLGKKLRFMVEHKPYCRYCGVKVVLSSTLQDNMRYLDNAATLDHVFSMLDIRRYCKGANKKVVLCCYKCNQAKNNRENRLVYNNDYKARNNEISIIELLNGASVPFPQCQQMLLT